MYSPICLHRKTAWRLYTNVCIPIQQVVKEGSTIKLGKRNTPGTDTTYYSRPNINRQMDLGVGILKRW